MDSPEPSPENKLYEAITYYCSVERVKRLMAAEGFDVNHRFPSGETPLMLCVSPDELGEHNSPKSMYELAKFLIKAGGDPCLTDFEGKKAIDNAYLLKSKEWKDRFGFGYPANWFEPENMAYVDKIIELLEST